MAGPGKCTETAAARKELVEMEMKDKNGQRGGRRVRTPSREKKEENGVTNSKIRDLLVILLLWRNSVLSGNPREAATYA